MNILLGIKYIGYKRNCKGVSYKIGLKKAEKLVRQTES